MLPFRRILFAVDFSEACKAIVPHVQEMRRHNNAELTLLHAFEPVPVVMGSMEMPVMADYPLPHELRKIESDQLDLFAREMFPGLDLNVRIEDGEAASAIHGFIQHNGTDLLMIPTRGHGAVRRFLLGSVTAKVLHDVSCAVWTGVHTHIDEYKPQIPYRSILCALDFGEETAAVAKAAASIAQSYDARLILMHAVDTPPPAPGIDIGPYRSMLLESAGQTIAGLQREHGFSGEVKVYEGRTGAAVRNAALEQKADLVVIGRGHSQDRAGRIWSQLYSIVRDAPCPVLSI
jgi:nucleotide-binding universal stress UspA family protein